MLVHAKSNLGPYAPTLRYRLHQECFLFEDQEINTSKVVWDGEAANIRPCDVLRSEAIADSHTVRDEAKSWLMSFLEAKAQPADVVFREGLKFGFSQTTSIEAKRTWA